MKRAFLIVCLLLIACTPEAQPSAQPQLKPLIGQPPAAFATTQDGYAIAYNLYPGKPGGTPVILLHMLRRTKTDWDGFARWLQRNGYTVITFDSRGHGQSTGDLEKFKPADYQNMAYDIAAMKAVLENQGADVSKLALVGASIGANTALNYAANDADVATVVLLSPGLDFRGVSTANTKFNKPFLIIASRDDEYSAQSSQQIANNNPYAKLVLFENAGHGTNMFAKRELPSIILDWLRINTGNNT
ncbi:MAG: alpha/beta fold hydrolase [Candidatus Woesearchaeota archaeon]